MSRGTKALGAFAAAALILLCPVLSNAEVTSGADFLKIPRSARAIALGESYTAVLDDPTAIDYNPAALNTIKNIAISAMYQTWIDNTSGVYAAGAFRLADFVIGGNFYLFNYGGLTEYDWYGYQSAQYAPSDMNFKIAASMDAGLFADVVRGLSVGVALCTIQRTLLDESQTGFSLDVGANYKTTLGKILPIGDEYLRVLLGGLPVNAGFVVQNIGFAAETVTPMKFSAGLSFAIVPDLILSMDLSKDVYQTPWMYKMGVEYTIAEILSLRFGFNLGKDTGNIGMGVGIRYPFIFNNLRFDYAFSPLGTLGNNHNFSICGEMLFAPTFDDYYQKGIYYFNKKDYLKARDMWKRASKMEPENRMISENLTRLEEIVTLYELDMSRQDLTGKIAKLQELLSLTVTTGRPSFTIENGLVTFYYRTKSASIQSVSLTGDFNSWDKYGIPMAKEGEEWKVRILLKPGVHYYQFIINRTDFIVDPANPNTGSDSEHGRVSVVEVPPELPAPPVTNERVDEAATNTNAVMTNSLTETNTQLPILPDTNIPAVDSPNTNLKPQTPGNPSVTNQASTN